MVRFIKEWLEDRKWANLSKLTQWAAQFDEDPKGLNRYVYEPGSDFDIVQDQKWIKIHEIVVDSEDTKQQLLLAFRYLHDRDIDTDFIAVNYLVHLYQEPDKIVVRNDV